MIPRHETPGETRPHFQPMRELATHWRPMALALVSAAVWLAIQPELERGAPWIAAAVLTGLSLVAAIAWIGFIETESET